MKDQNSQRGIAPLSVIGLIVLILGLGLFLYWRFWPKPELRLICHLKTSFEVEEIDLVRSLASGIQLLQERFDKAQEEVGKEGQSSEEILKKEDSFIKERSAKIRQQCEELREKREILRGQVEEKLKKRNKKVDDIWQSAGQDWQITYDNKLKEFKASIAKRARELKLEWPEKFPIEAPDIYVSSFRLGLYRLSQGLVNKTKELAWAEGKLKEWRDFSSQQEVQHEAIKGKAFEAQFEAEGAITELQQQIEKITEELVKEEASLEGIQQQASEESNETKTEPSLLAAEKTKLKQELRELVNENRVAQEKRQGDTVYFLHLERKIKPGDYEVLARAKKDGKNYWGIVSVSLKSGQTVEIDLEDQHFRQLDAILQDIP